jgi:rod shape-determining protein MreD
MPNIEYERELSSPGLSKVGRFRTSDPILPIFISTVIASILVVYPLPYFVSSWRPLFFLLVMLFWVLCQPVWCGVWFAFTLGLISDFLLDATLGQYAMSFAIIAFLVQYFTRNQRVLTFVNLWIIVTIAVFLHLLIQVIFQTMADIQFSLLRHWHPWLSSILAWPLVYMSLKRWKV